VSHVKQINNYYDVLQGKVDALDIPAEEALKTQQMINAVYQSGKEKQRVHF
jgi:predicted dehydrogenase